jgi:hypothetical protein
LGFLRLDSDQLTVVALKLAERLDQVVVRVRETHGRPLAGAQIAFPAPVQSAVQVDGQEWPFAAGADGYADVGAERAGAAIQFDLGPFQPKAFAIQLASYRPAAAGSDN